MPQTKTFIANFTNELGFKVKRNIVALHIAQAQEIAKSIAAKNSWKKGEVTEKTGRY